MIDPRLLRDNPDLVRAAQAKRGLSAAVVDEALAADEARRAAIVEFESLRAEQKQLGKLIPQAQGDEKASLLERTKSLAVSVKAAELAQTHAEEDWVAAIKAIPNPAAEEAPAGGEDDFVVLETVGAPRDFAAEGFEPRDHIELGRLLGAIDLDRGAKVSGSRFYFLTGVGAELEFALINLAMEQAREAGFTQVIAPSLVKPRAMEGTGFLGQAADDVYRIEGQEMYLVGTSEVAMAAYHSDEILDGASLPLRYAAFSPCFRKEAGSHGKDTKGIIRVHWFDKVEMFVYTTTEDSYAEHQRLLAWEKEFLDKLELAYRVIDVAAGDLGLSAQRKFDCEAWIPTQQKYRELTSTSNCTEFQTRRLDTRGRFEGVGGGTEIRPISTLNGTLCAMTRTIVAILETHQQADGSVRVPKALQKWLGREGLGASRRGRWLSLSKPESVSTGSTTGVPWTPTLVALDIDGTLLIPDFEKGFSSEQVTEPVTEAVLDAVRAGAHVVLASGRAPLSMAGVADRLGLTALVEELTGERLHIVASNGSVVIRHAPMEVVHEITFDASDAVRTVLEHVPGAAVAVEEHGVGYRVNRLFPPGELDGEMIICDLDEMISTAVSRVIIRDPDSTSEDFVNLARKLGLHGTNYFIGWTAWLDIAPEGVSKASGLAWVCRDLGVDPAEVLAIGDGRNDIEMLQWAGRGVAMGQGPEVVRESADHVTAPVDQDGAALELRRWFPADRLETA